MAVEKSTSKAKEIGLTVSLAVAGLVPLLYSPASNVKDRLAQVRAVVANQSGTLAADADFKQAPEALDEGFARAPEALDAGFARKSDP